MARSLRLIPTEATPVSSRAATPEQQPAKKLVKTGRTANASVSAAAVPAKPAKARATPVANGFIALPVALQPSVPGLEGLTQYIYLRRKVDSVDNANDFDQSTSSATASTSAHTIFAVNLPHGSTEANIKEGIQAIVKARSSSTSGAQEKGKGKASDLGFGDIVESVEFVYSTATHRGKSVIEAEGIVHPSTILKKQEMEQLSRQENLTKKQKKALQLQLQQQKEQAANDGASEKRIHPLFVSADITTQEAVDHLFPSSSTLKAHITLTSSKAVQLLLNDKSTSSWTMTSWPRDSWTIDTSSSKQSRTRDEILFDLARPSADSVKLHVDDWMKAFDEANPGKSALARRAREAAAAEAALPKSKRAQAREAAEKAAKQAEYARKKALKRRRVYDDDFDEPEADADGWVTVTAGGLKGRSAEEIAEGEFEDEEERRQAELEGFVSGKRSVGIASKDFIKEQERAMSEERKKALAALNNKLGISGENDQDGTAMAVDGTPGFTAEEEEDASRGGGRGRKKKMKKSRGIEMGMYGFARREGSKKNISDLRARFEEDKRKIAEMKEQKRFRPY
ncbi:hypothetical protein P389DRAFT_209575 [Cystobasidium minutum MCA 4210]|uniref:uncharacterized protein n=1 Tax=Cystobasidium minutum MCA 4210 TaxID=1397322 RepID=UPI0034CFC1FC|eukprot:jgi/Rhomi1/209575/estExt_Genemark1.C_3_t10196